MVGGGGVGVVGAVVLGGTGVVGGGKVVVVTEGDVEVAAEPFLSSSSPHAANSTTATRQSQAIVGSPRRYKGYSCVNPGGV